MPDSGNRDPENRGSNAPHPGQTDAQATEQKMRRALGLQSKGATPTVQQRPEQARARHRFVQDGGVPVTVVNHRTDDSGVLKERVAELQAQLEGERAAHGATRRKLDEAQAACQTLQTRLAHNDLAHAEALQTERHARIAAQDALAAVPPLRRPGRPRVHPLPPAPDPVLDDAGQPMESAPARRGRPPGSTQREPKPVRWWTPSFRATKAKT